MNFDESYNIGAHSYSPGGVFWSWLGYTEYPSPWLAGQNRDGERAIGRKRERDLCGKAPAATPTIHVLSLKVGVGGGGAGRWQLYCVVKACREDVWMDGGCVVCIHYIQCTVHRTSYMYRLCDARC